MVGKERKRPYLQRIENVQEGQENFDKCQTRPGTLTKIQEGKFSKGNFSVGRKGEEQPKLKTSFAKGEEEARSKFGAGRTSKEKGQRMRTKDQCWSY